MKKRKIPLVLVLGICLILVSVSMVLAFQIRVQLGVRHSQTILWSMERLLPERTAGVPGSALTSAMPVLEIEGKDYVAMLEVPSFDIALPVADQWEQNDLFSSPCRFYGSVHDKTLIIGGADSPRQFGFCDKIEHGARITVTDMTGAQFTYTVSRIDRAKHAETQWLLDSDYELTLFCHGVYSMEYIAVRCDLASN